MEQRSFEKSTGSVSSISTEQDPPLVVWIITGDNYAIQAFRSKLLHLSQAREGKAFYQITSRSGGSGLAGALDRKLFHFNVLKTML